MPEDKKRSGCGCGGCLLFSLYSIVLIAIGMILSSAINNNWDYSRSKDSFLEDGMDLGFFIKNKATSLITGEESADSGELSGEALREFQDLTVSAESAYDRAMALLKEARNVAGDERQQLLRDVQKELQNSLYSYQQAVKLNPDSPELVKKISHITDLLKRMNPEK